MEIYVIAVLFCSFFVLLFAGVPISLGVAISSFLSLLVLFPADIAALITAQKMMTSLDSFGILAIPFFILAGNIMNTGGIAIRLVNLARVFTGSLPGSLAHTNIIANMLFGSISGSAASSAAAVGSIMAPIQEKENYDMNYCAAINITSCPAGLLIPPSNVLILYSLVSGGTSIAALFVAGYLPGILLSLSLMIVAAIIAKKNNYPIMGRLNFSDSVNTLMQAIPALMLIFIVIGGIIGGVFTATEASGIAVVYALALSFVYREMNSSKLREVIIQSVKSSSIVLFLISASSVMSWGMAIANIPTFISEALLTISNEPWIILVCINIILLIVGTFLDFTPAVLIFTPIFLPIVSSMGIDPVHFGIIMIFNLSIGICTPPVGNALFIGCSIANVKIQNVIRHLIPLYLVLIIDLVVIMLVPEISLFIPRLMGLL